MHTWVLTNQQFRGRCVGTWNNVHNPDQWFDSGSKNTTFCFLNKHFCLSAPQIWINDDADDQKKIVICIVVVIVFIVHFTWYQLRRKQNNGEKKVLLWFYLTVNTVELPGHLLLAQHSNFFLKKVRDFLSPTHPKGKKSPLHCFIFI